jgi:hypothetical protein
MRMRPPQAHLLLVAPLAALAAGCDSLIDIRVRNEQLCVQAASESFEPAVSPIMGSAAFPGSSATPIHVAFDKPLAEVPGAAADLDLDVRFDTVVIRSQGNLSFIKKVAIGLEPGRSTDPAKAGAPVLPTLPLGEFLRAPLAPGQTPPELHEINVPSTLEANVWSYLKDAPAHLRFIVTGKIPTEAFTADIEACVYIQGEVKRP